MEIEHVKLILSTVVINNMLVHVCVSGSNLIVTEFVKRGLLHTSEKASY